MTLLTKPEALLRSIDSLIENHGRDNPELLKELQELRSEVQEATRKGLWLDLAFAALRLATWIKFIFDHLPPTH